MCRAINWADVTVKKAADVYWVSSEADFDALVGYKDNIAIKSKTRINRIPGMPQICNKVVFSLLIQRARRLDPERFTFCHPATCAPPALILLFLQIPRHGSSVVDQTKPSNLQ